MGRQGAGDRRRDRKGKPMEKKSKGYWLFDRNDSIVREGEAALMADGHLIEPKKYPERSIQPDGGSLAIYHHHIKPIYKWVEPEQ